MVKSLCFHCRGHGFEELRSHKPCGMAKKIFLSFQMVTEEHEISAGPCWERAVPCMPMRWGCAKAIHGLPFCCWIQWWVLSPHVTGALRAFDVVNHSILPLSLASLGFLNSKLSCFSLEPTGQSVRPSSGPPAASFCPYPLASRGGRATGFWLWTASLYVLPSLRVSSDLAWGL